MNRKPSSPLQKKIRTRFAEAQLYAREMLADMEMSELYSTMAVVNGLRTAQLAAVKDFMSSPEIESIDAKEYSGRVGDVISIKPEIALKIIKVEITVYDANGALIESVNGIKDRLQWKYRATVINTLNKGSKVVIVAHDRLGKSSTVIEHLY